MSEFQNVLRANNFIWFIFALFFAIFTIVKLIKNQIDFRDDTKQHKYQQGQSKMQHPSDSMQRFDHSAARRDQGSDDDTIIDRWLKRVHQFEVSYSPILFPFALNVVTGTTYSFVIIIFFVSLLFFMLFNVWKLHRQCVEHPVLRIILESISYVLTFFLLLNVWTSSPSDMPYTVVVKV